jgi:transcriptional regulator with XRE-family HTH domain
METKLTRGARLLREWLDAPEAKRSQTDLAKTLGVSQPSVSAWLRGDSRPEDHHREALEIITAIPRGLWRRDAEQDVVERARAGSTFTAADFDVAPPPTLPATGTEG